MGMPTATVQMKGPDGLSRIGVGVGTGPVDAAYKAVDALVKVEAALVDYGVNSVTEGARGPLTHAASLLLLLLLLMSRAALRGLRGCFLRRREALARVAAARLASLTAAAPPAAGHTNAQASTRWRTRG